MPTNLSKADLATILSALDGQRRNPANRDKALEVIERRAAALGLTTHEILDAAPGLLDDRLSPKLIAMLQAPEGATIAEIVEATGWQPHTVRGAIAGALKKKLGLDVTSEKVEGRGRVYRIR